MYYIMNENSAEKSNSKKGMAYELLRMESHKTSATNDLTDLLTSRSFIMSKHPLTDEQKENIRQGLLLFYESPAGQIEIAAKKARIPVNKGIKGEQIPWNKGKKGTCKHTGKSRKRIGEANSKPILQYSKEGIFIKKWPSIIEAVKELRLSYPAIWYCLTLKRKSSGGYKWRYEGRNI
jgi:hypothetical protein